MTLSPENYRDRIQGGWTGKCLAGAIGMPYEGVPYQPMLRTENIHVQDDVPNDDLELQLVWLVAMEQHGLGLTSEHLAHYWTEHIRHGCDEYSIAIRNLRRGIQPPISGQYDNYFHYGMGAAIRSEIWAMMFPARPDAAGHFAEQDAVVDHWGDGVWAEIYLARAESQILATGNIGGALKAELTHVPRESRLYRGLSLVFELHEQGLDADTAQEIILRRLGHHNFTDCVMNLGIIVFALLWGESDFIKTVLLATNCGRDTDCTAATCGAILGLAHGLAAMPTPWMARLSPTLSLSENIAAIESVPRTLSELCDRTIALQFRLAAELPTAPYPNYTPVTPAPLERFDEAQWLVLDESEHDIAAIKDELLRSGTCPEELRPHVITQFGLHLDLSAYAHDANSLSVFSFLHVVHPEAEPREVVLSATADVGMTLWFDRDRLLNHHSRQLAIPSFHRAEGGAAFQYPLQHGDRKLVHIKLYSCLPPVRCTLMFGNMFNDHLDGFQLRI